MMTTAMNCFTFAESVPGTQIADVGTPDKRWGGWALRAQKRLAQKVFPETALRSHIRGHRIAVDYLFEALLKHSRNTRYTFVVDRANADSFKKWAETQRVAKGSDIRMLEELFTPGLDVLQPDIWLSLMGNGLPGIRCRNIHSSRLFPTVGLLHGLSDRSLLSGNFLQLLLLPSYGCDSLVCTSRACQKAINNILDELSNAFNSQFRTQVSFKGRLDRIPLCIDTDAFKPDNKARLRKELGISKESLVILYVGYIALIKADLTPLFPMLRRLLDANPGTDIQFIIAGTGPEAYILHLQALIQAMKLSEHVKLHRSVSEALKRSLYAAADIFVAPCDSIEESFGLTPVEAMASGLPQVVADWSGYRDTVLHGETGFLVPTQWGRCDADYTGKSDVLGRFFDCTAIGQSISLDIAAMQNSIQLLISSAELRATMSAHSRIRAVAEFSYANVARQYEELFCELAAISASLQQNPRKKHFDEGAYFDFFGHFATNDLPDECRIKIAEDGTKNLFLCLQGIAPKISGFDLLLDQSLLMQVLAFVDDPYRSGEGITVGDTITQVKSETRSSDSIRRHILFLLKHGLLLLKSRV